MRRLAASLKNSGAALASRLRWSKLHEAIADPSDLTVLLATPPWTIFRSTDRSYVYNSFSALACAFHLRFLPADSIGYVGASTFDYLWRRARQSLGIPAEDQLLTPLLPVPAEAGVTFSYGSYPRLQRQVPVLWEQTFAPQLGMDHASWRTRWRTAASSAASAAERVVTATSISAEWFCDLFPKDAHKIRVVPYFLPTVQSITNEDLEKKDPSGGPVRFLFVGKEGRRKGLDTLIAAWRLLPKATRDQSEFRVVSQMIDGQIRLPEEWEHLQWAPDINAMMKDAHVLLFPTKQEAFGLVLVEAMAAGCAPLTTMAPIQQAIVGQEAGTFVDPQDPQAVADAITTLVNDRSRLRHRMNASVQRFTSEFDPKSVGQRYANLLFEVSGRGHQAAARQGGS